MSERATKIHDIEKSALLLDRHAVAKVVSALREFRMQRDALLNRRFRDGAVDGATLSRFEDATDAALDELVGES